MSVQKHWNLFFVAGMAIANVLMAGCSRQVAKGENLPPFIVTNEVVDGQLRQVIEATNGLSLYFTKSYITVWFSKGYDTVIGFDPKTLKPKKVLWDMPPSDNHPGQEIFDVNADGVPDIRKLKDASKTRQIFYKGEWRTVKMEGSHTTITVDGKKLRVYFNGRHWLPEPTNNGNDIVVTNAMFSTRF